MEKLVIAALSLLLLVKFGAGAPISCPTSEDLHPCTCKRMAYGLHIVCADFEDNHDLVRAMRVLRDYQVQNVLLHNLMLTQVLPSDLFDGLEINELRVEKSNLKFPQPAFVGLDDSLHVLNVAQRSTIKSSENFSLARLNKLTELNMKKNPMKIVKDQWLNGKIPNVRSIRLDEDDITQIESHAFANLPHLQYISLAGNRIKKVERSMFPRPANALKTLDLSANQIESLPYDFFFDMPNLEEVIFSGNDLDTLPELTWKSVWEQLDSVLLYENNLVCDSKLNWLKNVKWPRQVVGKCENPEELSGKSLQEIYNT